MQCILEQWSALTVVADDTSVFVKMRINGGSSSRQAAPREKVTIHMNQGNTSIVVSISSVHSTDFSFVPAVGARIPRPLSLSSSRAVPVSSYFLL